MLQLLVSRARKLSSGFPIRILLSTDRNNNFNALILSVFGDNKNCPTRDITYREGKKRYVHPAWKQSCDAVVKWDGTKFTYKRL